MGAVLAFPVPERVPSFDQAWALLPPTMRRRSDSRAKCAKLWANAAKRIGPERLLGALKEYLASDKDLPRTGGAGLQVWLRAERWDHWIDAEEAPVIGAFEDKRIRQAVLAKMGEAWVRSYLDPCTLDGTRLIVRTDYAVGKLKEQGGLFKALGLTGMKKAD